MNADRNDFKMRKSQKRNNKKEEKLLEDGIKGRGRENCMYEEEVGRECVRKAVRKRRK
jgi:hypothetical protein